MTMQISQFVMTFEVNWFTFTWQLPIDSFLHLDEKKEKAGAYR